MINLKETPDSLDISGSYAEMKEITSKLKSRGFYWDIHGPQDVDSA